jgi:hypothetical protein
MRIEKISLREKVSEANNYSTKKHYGCGHIPMMGLSPELPSKIGEETVPLEDLK